MSAKPREWPQLARSARDQAAELAIDGMKSMESIIENNRPMSETERLRRENKAYRLFQKIAWLMHSQGAPIRPENL